MYLGHIISKAGVTADNKKIQDMKNLTMKRNFKWTEEDDGISRGIEVAKL